MEIMIWSVLKIIKLENITIYANKEKPMTSLTLSLQNKDKDIVNEGIFL